MIGFVSEPSTPRGEVHIGLVYFGGYFTDSVARVRRELVALYADAKAGRRDVGDTSKLAHVLGLIGRLIEADELERRLEALEARDAAGGRR